MKKLHRQRNLRKLFSLARSLTDSYIREMKRKDEEADKLARVKERNWTFRHNPTMAYCLTNNLELLPKVERALFKCSDFRITRMIAKVVEE